MKLIAKADEWAKIKQHLLPETDRNEHAAFMYGRWHADLREIEIIGQELVQPHDLESEGSYHLELTQDARQRQIKRAHDLDACLIELHSHPFSRNASFSLYDMENLRDTVPHMLWRLPGRPYVAIVVAQTSFDALVWEREFDNAALLEHITAGGRIVRPTNSSLSFWR